MDKNPFSQVLRDATRLKPSQRLGFVEDARWLFQLRLHTWLKEIGAAVQLKQPKELGLYGETISFYDETPATYPTGVAAHPLMTINAKFCLKYGFDEYSYRALNYAHVQRDTTTPADYIRTQPLLLGNFGIALSSPPTGGVPPIPSNAVRCVACAESARGKTRSSHAWLGVWFDRQHLNASDVAAISSFSDLPSRRWPPISSAYMSEFMRHFGHLGDNESELRERLGYPEKGKPVAEKILLRSVHEVFRAEPVLSHYRGRELGRLELDIFLPQRKLAFEYQGEQHFQRVAHWHSEDGLAIQQARDARKRELCEQLGYRVIYVMPGSDIRREGVIRMLRRAQFLQPEFGDDEEPALCQVPPIKPGKTLPLPRNMTTAEAIQLLDSWWNQDQPKRP